MITLRSQLVLVADAFGVATNRSRARVSTMVLNQGRRLDLIASAGMDITTERFERAMAWFSANWPDGAAWPADVPRPPPQDPEGGSEPDPDPAADAPSAAVHPCGAAAAVPQGPFLVPATAAE